MDWFSWLSRTGLEPSFIYEYGLVFSRNELRIEDLTYFNHELLQSMGISIAKHRLEILRLAKEEKTKRWKHFSEFRLAIKKTRKYFRMYVSRWVHREDKALVVVPELKLRGGQLSEAFLSKQQDANQIQQQRLMLTNKSPSLSGPLGRRVPSPMARTYSKKGESDGDYEVNTIWSTLFQDLKPN